MKRSLLILVCMAAMMAAGPEMKAQEVTITLSPGLTWISYPGTDTLDIATVLGSFIPMQGDIIKSQTGNTGYKNGQWRGSISQFYPGQGYMYKSTRTEAVTLTFNVQQPSFPVLVTTIEPTDITSVSAVVGGTVTIEEGNHIFARGICWGTEPNPNIDGNHIVGNAVAGSQSIALDGLIAGTTYYVRAYVVPDFGLVYGQELSFATPPEGAINGLFSINANGDQVYFSQGNLQYIGSAATPYWKFAENQWDCLGTMTGQNSSDHNVDRDLFGWGTSGWDPGNTCYHPWDTYNSTGSSYGPKGSNNLYGNYANADWGVYNPISNGGNQPNQWRTPTTDEWEYVFNIRTTASGIRYAKANVNECNGVILLPDDWSTSYYDLNDTNTDDANYSNNTITASEWSTLEQHGAIFLPANGYRFGAPVYNVGSNGYYWSSSFVNGTYAYGVYFLDSNLNPQDCSNRSYGRAVRLVQDAE